MTNIHIAAAAFVALMAAAPAFANGEPRTLENLFPGWTTEATGLPSENRDETGARVRDFAIQDRYETGDQLALTPETWTPRPSSHAPFMHYDEPATAQYSRN
ncbi:hypothetical protein [Arenibaculum pallidiluteum]|uniref:hypothetical protein n=1 Tax=Arenibaculum pallidiluteum TaxID=2812559 RepID=UPI001A9586EA|nr:hypothetical protein [Arenibaculum pallidiluteum]